MQLVHAEQLFYRYITNQTTTNMFLELLYIELVILDLFKEYFLYIKRKNECSTYFAIIVKEREHDKFQKLFDISYFTVK